MPYHRNLNGQGRGLGETSAFSPIVDALIPEIKKATFAAAEASEPMIRRVVVNDVVPYIILGLVLGAVASASIGAWFATRRR